MAKDKLERHIAFCAHCGNTAPQRVAYSHVYATEWYSSDGQRSRDDGPDCEAILCVCETCNAVLLYDGLGRSETGEWPPLAYPRDAALHGSAPAAVSDVYSEAARVRQNAPRAFALLIRRALEAICDDRDVPAGSLAQRLRELATRGDIPPTLAEVTDVLRVLGNIAAHGALQVITVPTAWAIDEFFRAVIEYVYVAPSKLREFKEKLARAEEAKRAQS